MDPGRLLRRAPVARRLAGALAVAWIGIGLWGAYAYTHAYYVYRGFPPPRDPAGVAQGALTKVRFFSPALGARRSYLVYTPPGYASAAARGRRFPVLYLLHAPPGRPDGYIQAGAVNVRADILLARHVIHPFLMVLPYGKSHSFGNDTEWADARAGRYEGYVLDTVRAVDGRWATRPDRTHRVIAGLSEGAYGAANLAVRHLDLFGGFQSWSGYFTQTPTGPFAGLPEPLLRANSPTTIVPALAPRLARLPLRAFLYQGGQDDVSEPAMLAFAGELRRAGAEVGTAVYPGHHSWQLWRGQVPQMLRLADRWFRHPARPASPLKPFGRRRPRPCPRVHRGAVHRHCRGAAHRRRRRRRSL